MDLECAHIMCDDYIKTGIYKNLSACTGADDYAEAAQGGCDGQPTTVDALISIYNKKNGTDVKCDN